jgi:hypothetical protein
VNDPQQFVCPACGASRNQPCVTLKDKRSYGNAYFHVDRFHRASAKGGADQEVKAAPPNNEYLEARRSLLQKQMLHLDTVVHVAEKLNTVPEGGVITWKMSYQGGSAEYSFAAILTPVGWYTTGTRAAPSRMTTEQFAEWLSNDNILILDDLWYAKEWELL